MGIDAIVSYKFIMKFIFTFVVFFMLLAVSAQDRPQLVPFKSDGKLGLMSVSGMELVYPDSLRDGSSRYDVIEDFRSYIIQKNENEDCVIDAYSGQEQLSGHFDQVCGRLKINKDSYYHFDVNGNSVLLKQGSPPIKLTTLYQQIEPNQDGWNNESLDGKQYIWALKTDETYDVLSADNNFDRINSLPNFESFDLVYRINEDAPITLVGFVLGSKNAIQRVFGQKYGIPESDRMVEVYDIHFKKLGTTAYQAVAIKQLFHHEIELQGGMMPPPSLENQIIIPQNKTIVLSNEFSLVPKKDDQTQLILINTQQENTPVLGNSRFDYRYISTPQNLKALLQIRHAETGTFFYFDFNGLYFPKGIPLIPENYQKWN
ncbi:hypothetical protein BWD42_22180 [Sphingobacterium sp. CZ-UAM]|nr:hypothetical protein BWD42_22180 [Sphingobacterium sp. CZ-UAM]